MGGEGGGVLTGWIVDAARKQGLAVQATSVPGVAQRTGGTTYYIEMAPRAADGRSPVFALTPVPGQVDVVLASELVEGARAARLGLATPDRTTAISSTHRVFLMPEKMAMGDGRLDETALRRTIEARAARAMFLDMDALAQSAGVPISPVLAGALAGSGVLPIDRRHFEAAIRDGGIAVERNLAAFEAACKRVGEQPREIQREERSVRDFIMASGGAERSDVAGFPEEARNVVALGIDRLRDYQDEEYARLFVRRLEPFRPFDPALLEAVARHLAVRMSYEDVIRVAQHKARAQRFERIANELGSKNEPYEVQDFFKPGVREIADILPPRLARRILSWAERNPRLGRTHVGMKVKTTTITGYLRVWTLAQLKGWRRRTFRYEAEQSAIDAWLGLVRQAADRGATPLAREIAELARLIKGYGDTHERGQASYAKIVEAVVAPALGSTPVAERAAEAVRTAREAALADPEGESLARVLARFPDQAQPSA
jgi:indolepyruvate ferredoxin oxidoreductase beta subunit